MLDAICFFALMTIGIAWLCIGMVMEGNLP